LLAGILILSHVAWPPKLSFEIWVEASTTLQLLHFSCLQNQYDMDYANIYHQLKH
jgi:hypothetical protein